MILYSNVFEFYIFSFFLFFCGFNSVAFAHLYCKPSKAALPLTPVAPSAAGVVSVASSPARAASEAGWGSCQKLPGKLTRIEVGGFPFFVKFSSLILGDCWSKLTNLKKGLVQPPTRHYCTVFEKGGLFSSCEKWVSFLLLDFCWFSGSLSNSSKGIALYLLFWIGFNDFWILVES